MAFQPIVDVSTRKVFAYEALVRGTAGEPAGQILGQVTEDNRYTFDQACRVRALELAASLRLLERAEGGISINFLPGAVYEPAACLRATLETAARVGFPIRQIMFEVTEDEKVRDNGHLRRIFTEYRKRGILTAIDDFGGGYSGLTLLSDFQPDVLKLDMALTRGIDADAVRRAIVAGIVTMCRDLSITLVAEGIETVEEMETVRDLGINRMQGYLFARPEFEALPTPRYS